MDTLFFILLLVSFIGLPVGLIKPSWFKMKSRKQVGIIFGSAIVAFFVLFGITSSSTTTSNSTSSQANNSAPETSQQKLQGTVQSILQNSSIQASLQDGIQVVSSTDKTWPPESQSVEINVSTGETWDNASFITETGQLSASLFQQIFPIDTAFYQVSVRYYAQVTDQYGNTTTSDVMNYEMDRPLYAKINWSGLSTVQNDTHMCAFIRNEQDGPDDIGDGRPIGCYILSTDLQAAEKAIETQNASQYPYLTAQSLGY